MKIYFITSAFLLQQIISLAQSENTDSCIQDIFRNDKVMGMSVAIVKKNNIIYQKSFGWKDRELNVKLTNDCIFRIASISKSFSATSIMQLVERRLVSLNDDVSDLMGFQVRNPKYPNTKITLKMLLSHLSSINDSQGYFTLDAINPNKNPDWAKCYNDYEPGKGYMYCNLNFNMVGTIIEKKSGERFDQYVKHHILDPLGLYGGYCVDSLDKNRFAKIYEYNVDSSTFTHQPAAYNPRSNEIANYTMGYSTPLFSPTGGMKISAPDLAKYMMMHSHMGRYRHSRIISKKSARTMQTKFSDEEGYGLAIMNTEKLIPGVKLKGHTGSAYGLYSAMFWQPRKKFGFVVISNGCSPDQKDHFNNIINKTINCLYQSIK